MQCVGVSALKNFHFHSAILAWNKRVLANTLQQNATDVFGAVASWNILGSRAPGQQTDICKNTISISQMEHALKKKEMNATSSTKMFAK